MDLIDTHAHLEDIENLKGAIKRAVEAAGCHQNPSNPL